MSPDFKFAFKKSIPIMTGFIFLGIAYGIYMHQAGFNFIYPTCMAFFIFGGSVEFIVADLLAKSFSPFNVFLITLIVNSRHLFYGISMLQKYNVHGFKKFYLIFGMCDETFAINSSTDVPEEINKINFMFWVTVLNQFYWVFGAFLGGILGSLITINLKGLDFVMTALFIVLFMDQFLKKDKRFGSILGMIIALLVLAIAGKDIFMPLSMIIVVILFAIYDRNKKGRKADERS